MEILVNSVHHGDHGLLAGAAGDHVVPRDGDLAEDGEGVPWQQV